MNTSPDTSIREIAIMVDRSATTVQYHMNKMREKNIIDWQDGICRSINVLCIMQEI